MTLTVFRPSGRASSGGRGGDRSTRGGYFSSGRAFWDLLILLNTGGPKGSDSKQPLRGIPENIPGENTGLGVGRAGPRALRSCSGRRAERSTREGGSRVRRAAAPRHVPSRRRALGHLAWAEAPGPAHGGTRRLVPAVRSASVDAALPSPSYLRKAGAARPRRPLGEAWVATA